MGLDSNSVHPYGSFWLDVADKGIKALALIVGGVWTYINFSRSRIFRRRLDGSISGEIFSRNGDHYALILCRLKNVGQSKYTITQKGTGLEAITLSKGGRTTLGVSEVFTKHGWVESGEQVEQPLVIAIPAPHTFVALELNLRVISQGLEWNISCMVKS
jgi:hypothetical protein